MFKEINKISLFAFFGAVYYFLSIFFVQFLRTDRSFIRDSLSSYAVGNMGFILEIGIILISLTEIIISLNLFKIGLKLNGLLLFLCGFGCLIIAAFPSAPIHPNSLNDRLHVFGCIPHFLFFPLVIFLLKKRLSQNNFKSFFTFIFLTVFILEIVVTVFFFGDSKIGFNYFGVIEKILCIFNTSWLLLVSYKMIKPSEFESLFS